MSIVNTEALEATRDRLAAEAQAILDRSGDVLDPVDAAEFDRIAAELEQTMNRLERADYIRNAVEASMNQAKASESRTASPVAISEHPLAMPVRLGDELDKAIRSNTAYSWDSDVARRAALTTSTYGTDDAWTGGGQFPNPQLLHIVGGVQTTPVPGLGSNFPQWTLPGKSGSVAETASLPEFAGATLQSVQLARFGRWTDISQEARLNGTAGILSLHSFGIASDLNAELVSVLTSAAGDAVALVDGKSAEYMLNLGIATIATATAANPGNLVVVVNPSDFAGLASNITPTSGSDIGETLPRFAGAILFPSQDQTAGSALVANLGIGVQFAQAQALSVNSIQDPKTGVFTVGSSLIGGYGVRVAGSVGLYNLA